MLPAVLPLDYDLQCEDRWESNPHSLVDIAKFAELIHEIWMPVEDSNRNY